MQERNLKNFFQKEAKTVAVPLIMLILGALFIILKGGILSALVTILGVLLIIGGVGLGLSLITKISPLTIFIAATLIILGVVCITDAFGVSKIVLRVIGFCILINAVLRMFEERVIKGRSANYKAYVINNAITAALGLVLLVLPQITADAFFVIMGIIMVIMGITNLISSYSFYKHGGYVNDGSGVVWEE